MQRYQIKFWALLMVSAVLQTTSILAQSTSLQPPQPPNTNYQPVLAQPAPQKCYYIRHVSCKVDPKSKYCIPESESWIEHDAHNGVCEVEHMTRYCPLFDEKDCRLKDKKAYCKDEKDVAFITKYISLNTTILGWCTCSCNSPDGEPKNSPADLTPRYDTEEGCAFQNGKSCKYWPDGYVFGEDARKDQEMLVSDGKISCTYSFARPEETLNTNR